MQSNSYRQSMEADKTRHAWYPPPAASRMDRLPLIQIVAMRRYLSAHNRAESAGFTLIELLVAVVVLSILVTIAVPSFRGIILNNRRVASINEFVVAINQARTLAITSRKSVTICRSSNADAAAPTCATGTGWESGWVSFVETSPANGVLDTGEPILRRHVALDSGTAMHGNTNIVNRITFNSSGITNNNGRITYCDSRGWGSDARIVVVSVGGRVQTVDSSGDSAPLLTACL